MSNYQYCKCGAGLNPSPEDVIRGVYPICTCGEDNFVLSMQEERVELLIQMYNDIQELKEKVNG